MLHQSLSEIRDDRLSIDFEDMPVHPKPEIQKHSEWLLSHLFMRYYPLLQYFKQHEIPHLHPRIPYLPVYTGK